MEKIRGNKNKEVKKRGMDAGKYKSSETRWIVAVPEY